MLWREDCRNGCGRAHLSLGGCDAARISVLGLKCAGRRRAHSGPGAHASPGGGAAARASQSWQQVPPRNWIKQDNKSDLCIFYLDLCLKHIPLLDICVKKSHVSKASTELRPSEVRTSAYRGSPHPAGRGANPARPYGLYIGTPPSHSGIAR